jgi:catechol 2,3-dioxygenase-like lactoylglutathione lyase family enzyme
MPPADRPLAAAGFDHLALSVGDLDAMVACYAALGFDEVSRTDFAPAPIRLVTVANRRGVTLELTANAESTRTAPAADPLAASRRRGPFHFALRVDDLPATIAAALAAGARLVTPPAATTRADARYVYLADPEHNLIELIGPPGGPVARS